MCTMMGSLVEGKKDEEEEGGRLWRRETPEGCGRGDVGYLDEEGYPL